MRVILLLHPGCEMRFREIRCDGFTNPINSWLVPSLPRQAQASRMGSPIYCLDRHVVLPCQVGKIKHACGEPSTVALGEEKCQEEDLVTADELP